MRGQREAHCSASPLANPLRPSHTHRHTGPSSPDTLHWLLTSPLPPLAPHPHCPPSCSAVTDLSDKAHVPHAPGNTFSEHPPCAGHRACLWS